MSTWFLPIGLYKAACIIVAELRGLPFISHYQLFDLNYAYQSGKLRLIKSVLMQTSFKISDCFWSRIICGLALICNHISGYYTETLITSLAHRSDTESRMLARPGRSNIPYYDNWRCLWTRWKGPMLGTTLAMTTWSFAITSGEWFGEPWLELSVAAEKQNHATCSVTWALLITIAN
jgi:hypothetical protein